MHTHIIIFIHLFMILQFLMITIGYCAWQEGAEASVQDRRISGPDHQVVQRRKRNQDQKRYVSLSRHPPNPGNGVSYFQPGAGIVWNVRIDPGRKSARP
jgi:hypothetical protein